MTGNKDSLDGLTASEFHVQRISYKFGCIHPFACPEEDLQSLDFRTDE